jgi:hypothetical protein
MVLAVAGRRIDAPDAETRRFPLRNVALVRERIRALFEARKPAALVSSAACGADLLALEQASALGIRYRVILPFERERFRCTSVTDRPGDWAPLYDRLLDDIAPSQDLILSPASATGEPPYAAVSRMILNEAESLAQPYNCRAVAVLVWDGQSRGGNDLTNSFGEDARQRGMEVLTICTVD